MIAGLLKDAASWLVSLTEASVAIAAILLIALAAGMTAFWVLSRGLNKLAGPEPESDPYDDEPDESGDAPVDSTK